MPGLFCNKLFGTSVGKPHLHTPSPNPEPYTAAYRGSNHRPIQTKNKLRMQSARPLFFKRLTTSKSTKTTLQRQMDSEGKESRTQSSPAS